jgi:hypothetical protein
MSTCLAEPGVIFLRPGALQACFVLLHPCLRILLAIYSEATACMRQLMCTAVSQLRSGQLVPLHHYAHLMYPACLTQPSLNTYSCISYSLHTQPALIHTAMELPRSTHCKYVLVYKLMEVFNSIKQPPVPSRELQKHIVA